ncbi:MAG: type II toxin-antitoxin system Phd/YefM family antitoxin [Acidobacteriota bacterium]
MFNITTDIQPMTTFRRHPGDFMRHLKATQRPLILTVNGKAEAVIMDAESYQRLLDIAAQADAREGIRQGLAELANGLGRPAREVFDDIRADYGIPR